LAGVERWGDRAREREQPVVVELQVARERAGGVRAAFGSRATVPPALTMSGFAGSGVEVGLAG
jgi:hypothetical protein